MDGTDTMDGAEFRRLVQADAHNQVTVEEAEWLRSGEVCERWRETLVSLISYYKSQRERLDRQLAEDEQRLLSQGGAATYHMCEVLHAQNISKIVQQMGFIQQRLGEANRICKTLHPPPASAPKVVPLPEPPRLSLKEQVGQLKQDLGRANQRIHNLERELREARETNARLAAAETKLPSVEAKLERQLAHAQRMEADAKAAKWWGRGWKNIARQLAHGCRLAIEQEEARGLDGNLTLVTFLRETLRALENSPAYPDGYDEANQVSEQEGAA